MTDTEIPEGFVSHAGFVAEYQATLGGLTLELPDGASLPADPPAEPEPGTQYEIGTGEVQALLEWLNAVENAAVDAHEAGDQELAAHWVRVAAKFAETDTYAKFHDSTAPVSWYDGVIVPALAGDLTNLAQDAGRQITNR